MSITDRTIFAILVLVSLALSIASLYLIPVAQVGVLLYGLPALYLVGFKEHNTRRWAYILGILGQPFWFITTIGYNQWGLLILVFFYTGAWGNGVYQHWLKTRDNHGV